jgi:2-polyprenyl-6-methoxyphenol hydroxylase-like FAD-dependent oxidoreductase
MAGVLLARAGVETLVLEKHKDFFRDFRGDTVHPSTMDVLAELGWLDDFLARPHQRIAAIKANVSGREITVADFSRVKTRERFVALMPQWDFLDFLAERGRSVPGFTLAMSTRATDLVEEDGRVVGVRTEGPDGERVVRADLVILADGRDSMVRERAGLASREIGAPMDVLWMRFERRASDPIETGGFVDHGHILVMLDRGDYWQTGLVIRKADFDAIRDEGIAALREEIVRAAPFLADRVDQIQSFDDVKLLVVRVNRLERWWRPGLLCIGDAAHAMSPIGGVGINLAIQDAVCAANLLAEPLRRGAPSDADLAAVQRRRELPTRATQAVQVFIQKRVIDRVLGRARRPRVAWSLRALNRSRFLQRIPARLMGVGFRPEHVKVAPVTPAPHA